MSNQNETRRFPTFCAALDRIEACEGLPTHIRAEIIDRVCDAHDGAPSDFIEARTMLQTFARVMRRDNREAVKALIDGIDLDAIRDESARVGCNYRDEPVGDEQAATDRARQRLSDIGLDESFLDIELNGCTLAEHLEWINTAPAEELRWTVCCWSPFGSSGTWGTAAVSQLGEVARRLRAELPERGYVAVEYIESIGGKALTSRVCAFAGEHGIMMAHRLPPDGVDICDPLNDAIIDGPVNPFPTQELAEDALRGENFQLISEDDDGAVWITHEGRVAYIQKCLPLDQVEVGYYYTEARS